ncbi:MAG: hypothetical protein M0Z59_07000 [Nitrospiraceae bacterium]|nr:hypothetical protein [Nitrospiraceae bacterium]
MDVPANSTDYTSPEGHAVTIPDSLYQHGLYLANSTITGRDQITDTVLSWVDTRVSQWVSSHPEKDPAELDRVARGERFIIIDQIALKTPASSSGLAVGLYEGPLIEACIYAAWSGYSKPAYNYPPHTLMSGDELAKWSGNDIWRNGKWYAGEMYSDGKGLYVIGHELDHAIGLHHDASGKNSSFSD